MEVERRKKCQTTALALNAASTHYDSKSYAISDRLARITGGRWRRCEVAGKFLSRHCNQLGDPAPNPHRRTVFKRFDHFFCLPCYPYGGPIQNAAHRLRGRGKKFRT
jgi:hypothetical protein